MAEHNVFVVQDDSEDLDRTVRSRADLSDHPDRPEPLQDAESARFWGVEDGETNRSYFEKMEGGDLVLFYRDGSYVGVGYVDATFEDEDGWVADTFWDDHRSDSIFTLRDFSTVSVPRAKVNTIFDYSDSYTPSGVMRVADNRVTNRVAAIKHAVETVSDS